MLEEMFKNFQLYFPSVSKQAVEYEQLSDFELMITLSDAVVVYDDFDKTIRILPASDDAMNEEVWKREFGRRIRNRMRHKGITQLALSEMTGISQVALSNYVNGKTMPGFFTAVKIAKALGCSVDDLQYS